MKRAFAANFPLDVGRSNLFEKLFDIIILRGIIYHCSHLLTCALIHPGCATD